MNLIHLLILIDSIVFTDWYKQIDRNRIIINTFMITFMRTVYFLQSFLYLFYRKTNREGININMKKVILKAYKQGTFIIGKTWIAKYCIITGNKYSKKHHHIIYNIKTNSGLKEELSYLDINCIMPNEFNSYDNFYVDAYEPGEYVYIRNANWFKPQIVKIIDIIHNIDYIAYTVQFSDGSINELKAYSILFKYAKYNIFKMARQFIYLKTIIKQEKRFELLDNTFKPVLTPRFIFFMKIIAVFVAHLP